MTNVEYDNEKEFNETVDKFEPMLNFPMSVGDMESLKASAIVSIAISLKRIADVICRPPPVVAGLDSMTPEMKEEWEKVNRVLGEAFIEKFK